MEFVYFGKNPVWINQFTDLSDTEPIILEEDRSVKWEVAGDSAYHIYEQEPAPEVRSHSEAGAIDPSGHVAQPVSYTHLDVYKRQYQYSLPAAAP